MQADRVTCFLRAIVLLSWKLGQVSAEITHRAVLLESLKNWSQYLFFSLSLAKLKEDNPQAIHC
jgi:hypothetical protein